MTTAPRRSFVGLIVVSIATLVCLPARTAAQQGLEYEVKAAFLYNFISFVTWPSTTFAAPSDPLRVCVVGADPFGSVLDRTMEGGSSGTHPLIVERVRDEGGLSRCAVVFVPRAADARASAVIRAVASRAVLTIGESPEFLEKGGMINFVLEGGKVRFDVNVPTAAARGLVLSSRLLRVARNTIRTSSGA